MVRAAKMVKASRKHAGQHMRGDLAVTSLEQAKRAALMP
jgi:hypothetical protein